MSEPNLAWTLAELQQRIGYDQGWGRGEDGGDTAWSTSTQVELNYIVKEGVQQFYNTPMIEGVHPGGHPWTFLRPTVAQKMHNGDRYLDMSDDFGGIEGQIVVSASGESGFVSLTPRNPIQIEQLYTNSPDATGRPQFGGIEHKKHITDSHGQRSRLFVWPECDATYTMKFQYYMTGGGPTEDRPYVYGGAEHSGTVLASCLAVAELRQQGTHGPAWEAFVRKLISSIKMDDRKRPQTYGMNYDCSDNMRGGGRDRQMIDYVNSTVTFEGTVYD